MEALRVALEDMGAPRARFAAPEPASELAPRGSGGARVLEEAEQEGVERRSIVERTRLLESALQGRDRQLESLERAVESFRARDDQRSLQGAELARWLAARNLPPLSELTPASVLALVEAQSRLHRDELSRAEEKHSHLVESLSAELRLQRSRPEPQSPELGSLAKRLGIRDVADLHALAASVPRLEAFVQSVCGTVYGEGLPFVGCHGADCSASAVPAILSTWIAQLQASECVCALHDRVVSALGLGSGASDAELLASLRQLSRDAEAGRSRSAEAEEAMGA